ncbi:MAG: MFS transporter [Crenarchaeota archaeon]|nr:MFS transporter [Thermoproteota archaeon]
MRRKLLILIGIICLLADLTYEGYRSILYMLVKVAGGKLAQLCTLWGIGDLAVVVGRVVGSLLSSMGIISLTYALGYILTCVLPISILYTSLPMIYMAYLIERFGKGVRGPSRDLIIRSIAERTGKAFGIVEALDQVGAVTGPLILLLLYYVSRSIKTFLTYSAIILIISSITLITCISIIIPEIRKVARGLRGRGLLRPSRRSIIYSIGVLFITACLFPIAGIQYISSISIGTGSGLIMFTICMIVSTVTALATGEISEKRISLILTVILPLTSIMSLLYPSSIYLVGVLYGVALAVIEVLFRGLASNIGDLGVYSIISLAICVGTFISSILFPFIYYARMIMVLTYVSTMYVTGLLIILLSLRK